MILMIRINPSLGIPYVVPGCMILETMWDFWNISKSALQMAIYFHAPVIADDKVTLVEYPERCSCRRLHW